MARKEDRVIEDVDHDAAIERYITCRLVGHQWQIQTEHDYDTVYGLWMLVLHCPNCTSDRIDAFDAKGEVMSRRYVSPDDYKAERMVYRPEVRRMYVKSQILGTRRRRLRDVS